MSAVKPPDQVLVVYVTWHPLAAFAAGVNATAVRVDAARTTALAAAIRLCSLILILSRCGRDAARLIGEPKRESSELSGGEMTPRARPSGHADFDDRWKQPTESAHRCITECSRQANLRQL